MDLNLKQYNMWTSRRLSSEEARNEGFGSKNHIELSIKEELYEIYNIETIPYENGMEFEGRGWEHSITGWKDGPQLGGDENVKEIIVHENTEENRKFWEPYIEHLIRKGTLELIKNPIYSYDFHYLDGRKSHEGELANSGKGHAAAIRLNGYIFQEEIKYEK